MEPDTNVIPFPIIPRKPADRPENVDRCYHCGTRLACLGAGDLTFTCRSCYESLRDAGRLDQIKRPVASPKQEYRCADCSRSLRVRRDEPHINCRCGAEMRPVEG